MFPRRAHIFPWHMLLSNYGLQDVLEVAALGSAKHADMRLQYNAGPVDHSQDTSTV
jgi:hypothetical protein